MLATGRIVERISSFHAELELVDCESYTQVLEMPDSISLINSRNSVASESSVLGLVPSLRSVLLVMMEVCRRSLSEVHRQGRSCVCEIAQTKIGRFTRRVSRLCNVHWNF